MTSMLRRLIDLEIEEFLEEQLEPKQEMERNQLLSDIEANLPKEFTEHRKEYEFI